VIAVVEERKKWALSSQTSKQMGRKEKKRNEVGGIAREQEIRTP
jgi:hypothetical protein